MTLAVDETECAPALTVGGMFSQECAGKVLDPARCVQLGIHFVMSYCFSGRERVHVDDFERLDSSPGHVSPDLVEEASLVSEDAVGEAQQVQPSDAFERLATVDGNDDGLAEHAKQLQRSSRLLLD